MIHNSAIIADSVQIEEGVEIGAHAFIGENVILRKNVEIMPNAYLEHCEIGANTVISPYAAIGTAPQDLSYKNELTKTIIGANCQIREYVTVNRASGGDGKVTKVGDKCLLMAYSHVAHNCVLENEVIMANSSTLGGHVSVGFGAFIGGMTVFHQNIRIGEMAIISGASASRLDILPYTNSEGIPAIAVGVNAVGLRRRGVSANDREAIRQAVKIIKSPEYNVTQALEEIEKNVEMNEYVRKLVEFVRTSKRGVCVRSSKDFIQTAKGEDE
ncbi:acyl-[acyl-carrier-protein]--UDP-N-acetylglucosamO-acyltransferase [Candidatus Gastranaerophilus sp. (ex Termes propinquus)]|nr:acyl-[acyl-carrier-protein]--UDP-N-acetylglucosamO-acyltransferase [Candidatus Gastranaerophilus sp. (ex Termes propinquus)]